MQAHNRTLLPFGREAGTKIEPKIFTQLGASTSGDSEALTAFMRTSIGDNKYVTYVAIAGTSKTEAKNWEEK